MRNPFKRHEHCWHIDPISTLRRKCCLCPREEHLAAGPLKGHGPYVTDSSNPVWTKVEFGGL